ncbi:MAG TPA: HEAT repeat domain-containing protein [Planctomycetota bacterium]|nr:HEAT repeat domain-containing protein [Planctomycetota bacterium]HRR81622.1 HEAT repeat domain-containing protein [Planctomycetota bacterium]HRT97331.1 HEAT repeat domain-containing protein [Planctomycetota bacterium]
MPASEQLKALVEQIPDHDKGGSYVSLTPEAGEAMRTLAAEILKGGRENVLGLVDLLVEPKIGEEVKDIKPHYALHLVAVHVTGEGQEKARAEVALALASQLGGDRPKAIQKYLIQEIQLCGGKEVTETLGKMLLDPDLYDDAARALAAIKEGAADVLLAALPNVKGRARLSVIKKLAVLKCEKAADVFKQALAEQDLDIRIAGAWGISRIADASASEALLKAADGARDWERLNLSDAAMSLADALLAAGKKPEAAAIYAHMATTRTDPTEKHIKQAAERGLAATK